MFSSNTTQVSDGGYQISRSLRFNSADSAYLNRTPASASNRTTFTISFWTKITKFDVRNMLFEVFGAGNDNDYFSLELSTDNKLGFGGYLTTWRFTNQVFRDPSAWYHIVVAIDTTQATANNRARLYVNGSEITSFAILSNPTQNSNTAVDSTFQHKIGNGTGGYYNGYMTEYYLIDGQALTPSSFGETNAQTGVWQPKAYSGSYGTNGFYLNFSDNSNTTAATLGKDYSGNGNNWTPNNFSVTAGAGNDSLVDVPTSYGVDTGVGGTVRGNYATLNPLSKSSSITLANGNLDASTAGGGAWGSAVSTLGLSSGKWYFEATCGSGVANPMVGYTSSSADINTYLGGVSGSAAYFGNGSAYINGSPSPYGASYTTGDVIGVAIDMDAGTIVCYKNNTTQGTLVSGLTGTIFVGVSSTNGTAMTVNMGQRPFAYTAPSGFKALCTQNLPTPTIGATTATQAGKYFNPVLYTGTDSAQTITGVGFQPDFVWIKNRTAANAPKLTDVIRGAGYTLSSAETGSEQNQTNQFTAFASDGFSVATNGGEFNASGKAYVAWNWKANGSGSTNTAGSITSTVSANTTSGFSIVTYTGTGANATVGHGLGVAPSMILIKSRSSVTNWNSYHIAVGASATIILNTTSGAVSGSTFFNSTAPTSTVFSLGSDGSTNPSGAQQVAYCFAPIAGYSAFGSYTGNGSADGPFIFTGFRPAFVLIKRCDSTSGGYWRILDDTRNTSNVVDKELYPNDASAEGTFAALDFTSNGVKIRNSDSQYNGSSALYLYACFAEVPLKFSLAR